MSLNLNDSKAISIHAPARGATDFPRHSCRRSHAISIHAPARGATKRRPVKFTFPDDFNPRSREGSDQIQREAWDYGEDFNPRSREGSDVLTMQQFPAIFSISIHAPARGATMTRAHSPETEKFQSTLPRGERQSNRYHLSLL